MSLKYKTLADTLRQEICEKYRCGDRLPTELQLVKDWNVSRQTVRQALSVLLTEGLIEKKQGSGTYVADTLHANIYSSKTIAILTAAADGHTCGTLWHAQSMLTDAGYQTQIFVTNDRISKEREILESLLSNPPRAILAEGVRTAFPTPNQDLYETLLTLGTKIRFIGSSCRSLPQIPTVCSDDYAGGALLTDYLLSQQHTRIGGIFCSNDLRGHDRYLGCINTLRDQLQTFDDRRFLWYDTSQRSSYTEPINRTLLLSFIQTQLPDCSAVICFSKEIADFLIHELQKLQIHIPHQLTVAAFDTTASRSDPSDLICAFHASASLWRTAAKALLDDLDRLPAQNMRLPFILNH